MRLTILRHGMTEANEKKLYCGRTDLPLSARGREELLALRETVRYPAAEFYVTSGMARATETLRILYGREPQMILPELNEMDFGDFEMSGYEELKHIAAYQRWIEGGCETACPGGESRDILDARVAAGLRALAGLGVASAVAVCHGGVIVSVMERFFPGQKNFYEWQPKFGRGYALDIGGEAAVLIAGV